MPAHVLVLINTPFGTDKHTQVLSGRKENVYRTVGIVFTCG